MFWARLVLALILLLRSVPDSRAAERLFLVLRVSLKNGFRGARHGRELISFGLALNGSVSYGYFYTTVQLGTPGQEFAMVVDTGSSTSYVPCVGCGTKCGPNHLNPPFDPAASSSAEEVPCNSPQCACIGGCSCNNDQCSYSTTYLEGSSSTGHLVSDLLGLNGSAPAARVVFGCQAQEAGIVYSQQADGVLGLADTDVSVMNQLVEQGAVDNVFSLCLGAGAAGDGLLLLGAAPLPGTLELQYTPLQSSQDGHYYANLTGVGLGDQWLAVDQSVYHGGALFDSGTTFSMLPTTAFQGLVAQLDMHAQASGLSRIPGPDPRYEDVCYAGISLLGAGNLSAVFPELKLQFDQMPSLVLPPANYLFPYSASNPARGVCLGISDNGDAGTYLGAISLLDMVVQFDRANKRVGFSGPVQCSQLESLLQG